MYQMKRVMMLFVFVALALSTNAQGQTLKDGIKMYFYQKYNTAQSILTPLADADPLANYYLGLSYLDAGDIAKASARFSKFPEDLANISGMARVAFAKKDVAGGTKIVKDLAAKARRKDWMPQKYAADAITYSEGGDYTQAVAWYKEALEKNKSPENVPEIRIGIGDAMRKVPGGGGEAMTNYELVTEKDKANSLGFSRIGDLWYEARNYQSALDNYERAKEADKTNPLPYKALADAYTRSGKYKLALENLKEYLNLSDNTPEDQQRYVGALYQAKSYCEAAKLADKLLNGQKDPAKVVELTGIKGFSQAECGDSTEALKTLHQYFSIQDPEKIVPGAYLEFGKLFMKLDMLDSAGFYYSKGITADTTGDKSDVYREVAEAFKDKKDYCKSAEWYSDLVKANPDAQASDYVWRVIMYYYCKDWGKAMTAANEFTAKHGDVQPSAHYWQARVAAVIDSEATTGMAEPFYKTWLEKVGGPNYEKKSDVKRAYQYLLYYYFNARKLDELAEYKEKMLVIDPESKDVKNIEALEKQAGIKAGK